MNEIFDKPIMYLGHAPSLKLLYDRAEEFKYKDVLWVSLNNLANVKPIMDKLDKELYAVLEYCPHLYKQSNDRLIILRESKARGSSTQEFLHQILDHEVKQKVFLFGVDGFIKDSAYFVSGEYPDPGGKIRDTETFNRAVELKELEVYNCSPDSAVKLFPKITIDECLEMI